MVDDLERVIPKASIWSITWVWRAAAICTS